MKPVILFGILLIVLGLVALAYKGITYTTQEQVAKLGPLEAKVERERTIPLPPILGGLALASGLVLVVVGARQR
ncbi:MAG TPA: DUF3185 domain-containing protein [Candidatus Binatia bacterium]|nr:DUF3185 domain-containing protein [Candidatus Binatia bacterium]